jgi:hypothetical protein
MSKWMTEIELFDDLDCIGCKLLDDSKFESDNMQFCTHKDGKQNLGRFDNEIIRPDWCPLIKIEETKRGRKPNK